MGTVVQKALRTRKNPNFNGCFTSIADSESKSSFMRLIFCFALLMTLSGCASGYSKFYTQRISDTDYNFIVPLKEGQIPIIEKTDDLRKAGDRYAAKNFTLIGVSSFNGPMESDDNIISQAEAVKATHVLQTSRFVTTQGGSTPLVTPNGFGGLNVTSMNHQQMRYDQSALFLAKSTKKLRVGVGFEGLTPDERKLYERNAGVVVRNVVEGTPAFDANIITGDLIISIDGKNVQGQDHAGQLLDAIPQSADKVMFKIIRKNIEKDILVSLTKP